MKRVVITGVTSGVGAGLAHHFSEQNWNVVGLARNSECLRKMERDLLNFWGLTTDVRLHKSVLRSFGRIDEIDVLINNAGIYVRKPLHEYLPVDIENVVSTNLLGAIYTTQCALPKLKANSRIINISSVAVFHRIENESVYRASKCGLDGFMESLSVEPCCQEKAIQITTIYPGGINTPLWNDDNKYFGDVNDLLTVEDIVEEVDSVVSLRNGVVKKKVVLCPSNESH